MIISFTCRGHKKVTVEEIIAVGWHNYLITIATIT